MGLAPVIETAVKPAGGTPVGASAAQDNLAPSAVTWPIMGRKAYLSYLPNRHAVQFSIADTGPHGMLEAEDKLQSVNSWNVKETGSRSYVNDAGLASLESDLELMGGVTEARVKDFIGNCVSRSERWLSRMSFAAEWGQDGAGPGTRKADVISSLTVPELLEILESVTEDASFELPPDYPRLVAMKLGESIVTFRIGTTNTSLLIRYELASHVCSCPLSDVNGWNRTRILSRTFLDTDGGAVLEADLDLRGGVTRRRVDVFVKSFLSIIEIWTKEIIIPNRPR
jgi:hypothetical protein